MSITANGVDFVDASPAVTGLQAGQTAWQVVSGAYAGALVRVQILRAPAVDVDGDGKPDIAHLQVDGAVIDAANQVQLNAVGEQKAIPTKYPGLMFSAVAEGKENFADWQEQQKVECLERLVTLMAELHFFESIPSA